MQVQSQMMSDLDDLRELEPYNHRMQKTIHKKNIQIRDEFANQSKTQSKIDKLLHQQAEIQESKMNLKMDQKQTEAWLNETLKMLSENDNVSSLLPRKTVKTAL